MDVGTAVAHPAAAAAACAPAPGVPTAAAAASAPCAASFESLGTSLLPRGWRKGGEEQAHHVEEPVDRVRNGLKEALLRQHGACVGVGERGGVGWGETPC